MFNIICILKGHKWKTYHRYGEWGNPLPNGTVTRPLNEFKKCKRCGKKK